MSTFIATYTAAHTCSAWFALIVPALVAVMAGVPFVVMGRGDDDTAPDA